MQFHSSVMQDQNQVRTIILCDLHLVELLERASI